MSQSCLIFGIDNTPYLNLKVEEPFKIGDFVGIYENEYVVERADEVTRENQLQNVYLKCINV